MTTPKTPNLNLYLPNFNDSPWHDEINDNFRSLDATIKSIFGIQGLLGEYLNSTAVTTGQRYFDVDAGFYYEAQSDFTTLAAPNTFAQERAAHPDRWEQLDASAAIQSATEAAASATAALASQTAAATSATNATNSATASATSATAAAGSATTASTKADEASTSATNAANSATEAANSASIINPSAYVQRAGDTMTGILNLIAPAADNDTLQAATTAFVNNKSIIKKVHVLDSGTDYATTSTTEVSLSDGFGFYPVSTTSRFLVFAYFYVVPRSSASSDDARADLRLSYYDSSLSQYIALLQNPIGLANVQPSNTPALFSYHSATFIADIDQSLKVFGTPADRIFLRLRGESGHVNTDVYVYSTQFAILEYENE